MNGERIIWPLEIVDNRISILLYRHGWNLKTLANEFGDAIFSVERAGRAYADYLSRRSYWDTASKDFLMITKIILLKAQKKPNPEDYD